MTISLYFEPITAQVLLATVGVVLSLLGLFRMLERRKG